MAEESSSNVASVAIVILVLAVLALGVWFFVGRGGSAPAADPGPDIEVQVGDGE